MANQELHGLWVILLSFLVAILLAVIPLPGWALWARPEWVLLVLIYWTIALPHRVGLMTALLLGVVLDAIKGAVFGQNALALMVVTLLCLLLYQRMRVFNIWQQAAMVFLLVGINQLLCQWVHNLEGISAESLFFLLPPFTSALLWPIVFHLLRGMRRHYRVS